MVKLHEFKSKIKQSFADKASKYLSHEMKHELGFEKPHLHELAQTNNNYDQELNTFWQPVKTQILSNKDHDQIKFWSIGLISVTSLGLVILLFTLFMPGKNINANSSDESLVIVEGKDVSPKSKQEKKKLTEQEKTADDIEIANIEVDKNKKNIASNSPLLKANQGSVTEYRVRSGDTLERIATRHYGSYSYEKIQRIKKANNIRNSRFLQIGQKLIIPF